jgi:hypothetical protein
VEERYRDVIAAVYGEREAVDIDTTIRFQDGKTARIQARLPVRRLPGTPTRRVRSSPSTQGSAP